ncbi:MAG: hypothetical protein NT062_34865 [Proteobacteria bacterium]|nr:hypothetical protein [Pseudomonadota bacterium]
MIRIRAVALVLLLGGGCKKAEDKPWLPDPTAPVPMTETEAKRGQDACAQYVEKICGCATAHAERKDVGEACKLAKGYPEGLEAALNIARDRESVKRDVAQSQDVARKTIKKCIEEVARLPLLGC